nr:unnamed protein product [Callosobruchus analis]
MTIVDFNHHHGIDKVADQDIYNSLSEEGKRAAGNFRRVSLRGKLGRTVHILLCKLVFKSLQLTLKHRNAAGVPSGNPYVFGLPGEGRHRFIEACQLLRVYSTRCGADRPDLIRGTHLRKHIATRSVLLNLNDNEISDLANYMGHSEQIHKSHYRLPIIAREITEISKLLEKAQGGDAARLGTMELEQ